MSDRIRTVTIDCFDVSIKETASGFELHFLGDTEGRKRHRVKLRFERMWWVRHIVKKLRDAVSVRRSEVEDAERALRGE